jgi:hypothetical protein
MNLAAGERRVQSDRAATAQVALTGPKKWYPSRPIPTAMSRAREGPPHEAIQRTRLAARR